MTKTTLNGKPAIEIDAEKVLWTNSPKAAKYRVNGIEEWVPNSQSKWNQDKIGNSHIGDIPGTLVIVEWLYNKLFK